MRGNLQTRLFTTCIFACAGLAAGLATASAERALRGYDDDAYPHITVPSEYDPSDTATGAVRRGPRGDEVRLPGGSWVPCGFNCFFTLRNATVDFWRRYDAPH